MPRAVRGVGSPAGGGPACALNGATGVVLSASGARNTGENAAASAVEGIASAGSTGSTGSRRGVRLKQQQHTEVS